MLYTQCGAFTELKMLHFIIQIISFNSKFNHCFSWCHLFLSMAPLNMMLGVLLLLLNSNSDGWDFSFLFCVLNFYQNEQYCTSCMNLLNIFYGKCKALNAKRSEQLLSFAMSSGSVLICKWNTSSFYEGYNHIKSVIMCKALAFYQGIQSKL